MMQTAGMTWTGFTLSYQRADSDALVEQARMVIDGAHEAGFQILLNVSGTPDQLAGADGLTPMPSSWAESPRLVLTRCKSGMRPISPPTGRARSIRRNMSICCTSPTRAIKAAHADTQVISAAPAPTSGQSALGSDQIWNDDVFYAGMAQAGAADYADCIGVDYYEGAVDPTAASGDPRDNSPTRYFVPMLQRAAASFSESGLPLCLTEFGYFSAEGGTPPDGFGWASATTSETAGSLAGKRDRDGGAALQRPRRDDDGVSHDGGQQPGRGRLCADPRGRNLSRL